MHKLKGGKSHQEIFTQMDDDSRFELKYRLNYFQYLKIRNDIHAYMLQDIYTQQAAENRYLVRSLYFDTYDYHAYYQKMNGDNERVKFRIRTYDKSIEEVDNVRVELKMRQGNLSIKKNLFVPLSDYQYFLQTRHWRGVIDPITVEFERAVLSKHILPLVLVEYDREGYITRLPSDLRVTFDHGLRSMHADTLFPAPCFLQTHTNSKIVMEVKFKRTIPRWLNTLVRKHGLKVIANSKFTQAIQISRMDLYHPDQVIMVR